MFWVPSWLEGSFGGLAENSLLGYHLIAGASRCRDLSGAASYFDDTHVEKPFYLKWASTLLDVLQTGTPAWVDGFVDPKKLVQTD